MTHDLFNAELEAQRSLMELYEHAEACRIAFERANIPLPEVLKRVLGMNGVGVKKTSQAIIPHPEKPPIPAGAGPDWIWINAKDATPTSLVMAFLREAPGSVLRSRDVVAKVQQILPNVSRGTISNVGTRLGGLNIELTQDGWLLRNHEKAGIVSKGYLWAPPNALTKSELAAQRRDGIIHLLGVFDSGLQIVQLVDHLRNCAWIAAPINKDLVKEDIGILAEQKKIRRRGNSKKWELVPTPAA